MPHMHLKVPLKSPAVTQALTHRLVFQEEEQQSMQRVILLK